jgi:hypothetical protein
MKPGDALKTIGPIRSQKTGLILPREGKFIDAVENLGRTLILVNFGIAGNEYLFPNEVLPDPADARSDSAPNDHAECREPSKHELLSGCHPHG